MALFASCAPSAWVSSGRSRFSSCVSVPESGSQDTEEDGKPSPLWKKGTAAHRSTSFKKTYNSLKVASILVSGNQFEWTPMGRIVGEKDESEPEFDAVELLPGKLWVGSARAAMDDEELVKRNIKFVLTVASKLVNTGERHAKRPSPLKDHAVLEVEDKVMVDLLPHFDEVLEWMDHAIKRGAVLVHCVEGISRSVTICLAWLMSRHRMTYKDAVAYVESKRPGADPNFGFRSQLLKYEAFGFDGAKAARSKITYLSIQ